MRAKDTGWYARRVISRTFTSLLVPALVCVAACAQQEPDPSRMRILTYNIQWFSEDANPDRIENVKAILNQLQPNIVAMQEIQSLKALRQLYGPEWQIAIKDDPKENQEQAIAVRAPYKLIKFETVFPGPTLDFAFPGGRDVMRAEVELPNKQTVVVYSAHLKSRRGGRWVTDEQREMAARLLAGYLKSRPNELSIVCGDMNDSPDDRSMNILESGDLNARPGPVSFSDPIMVNLMEPLYRKDTVTLDLDRKFLGDALEPVVEGAYAENEKWRGKEHKFPDDLEVTQTCFDQILIRPSLTKWYSGKTSVFAGVEALRGSNGRTTVDEKTQTVTYTEKGSQASDHLPVYSDFKMP